VSGTDRRLALLLVAASLALAALAFGPFLLERVLGPLASGLWLLLRVFVLSVDQAQLWAFLLLGLLVLAIFRVLSPLMASPDARDDEARPDPNSALGDLEYWRYLFSETPRDTRELHLARRELIGLLCSAFASSDREGGDYGLFLDFKERRIALPGPLYGFLFEDGPARKRLTAWLRKITGRDRAEYRRAVEECIRFLEYHMERRDE
jgi:hypothetical protein